jgi:hypothetical protein
MEQGNYEERYNGGNFGDPGNRPIPPQGGQPPFIPARPENGPVSRSQAKVIIILLICILAVNVAAFVTQNFLTSRGMSFSGGPGMGANGQAFQGGDGATRQQGAPDFSQRQEE